MLDKKIYEVCEKHRLVDPVELLIGLTNGKDMRQIHAVFSWVRNFDKSNKGARPSLTQWRELRELIYSESRFAEISASESLQAQKTLLEYQHPKKKSVDVNTRTSDSHEVVPLTPREIRRFKRHFDAVA